MNIVDWIIIALVGISMLFGLYKGFINSVFSVIGVLVALYAAFALTPMATQALRSNERLVNTLLHYADTSSRLGDLEIAMSPVEQLTETTIADIVSRVELPAPFDNLFKLNMDNRVFATLGSLNVAEYLNQTIVSVSLNILCFIVLFFLCYGAFLILLSLLNFVFHFPVLKQFDALLGGAFGIVRGIFLVMVLATLVPIVMTIVPIPGIETLIGASKLGGSLFQNNMIQAILRGGFSL